MLRPDQGLEPRDVGRVGYIERVQVETGPPHHVRRIGRRRPGQRALEDRLTRADQPIAVAVAVLIGIKTQPSRCPHLQQRERLRQGREHGHQYGASTGGRLRHRLAR